MRYKDGRLVRMGDRVRLGTLDGTVVFSIDTDEFSPDYPAADWSYLGEGVMIHTEKVGLIQCIGPDEDLAFVSGPDKDRA
ncbi:hypothetical protein ACLBXM_08840 [Xanthobacteraceae bacterium A53D]